MTAGLDPDLAVAYVTELSVDVRAVVVLDEQGARLAGPEALAAPARRLVALLPGGVVALETGTVVVASGAGRALVAVADAGAIAGPTLLDAAAALGGEPAAAVENLGADLKSAVASVIAAT